jgi:hypothetical protein
VLRNYYRERGRYAFLSGRVITLVDFDLIISRNEDSPGVLHLVTYGAMSFRVNSQFLQELDDLKKRLREN